jgi:methionyl aminopeptidase
MTERNDPCWCGSGRKYKKCHLNADILKGNAPSPSGNPMIKSPEEIAGMRRAGAFNGELMDYLRPFIKAGVSTEKINTLAHEYTVGHGHTPACLGYRGFPKSVCISINNVVCHGIPSPREVLKDGDIVNVDLTTIVEGFHGDSSETFKIGAVVPEASRLVGVTAHALLAGIAAARPGRPLLAIAEAIEPFVKSQGCSVVHQYTGHGIGRKFHEHFTVFHHITRDSEKVVLQPGMTLTVEPMINAGDWHVVTDRRDGWTVRTRDGSLSAQFEHTIAITESGAEVLTLTPSQKLAGKLLLLDE